MNLDPKPIRIKPAFADREQIRAMFMWNAPYRALAAYAPEGIKDETREEDKKPLLPWFRGDWALDGKPLVESAELILHNRRFVEAAKAAFDTSFVNPERSRQCQWSLASWQNPHGQSIILRCDTR